MRCSQCMRLQTQGKALECVLEREKQNAPGRFYITCCERWSVSVLKLTMLAQIADTHWWFHIVSSGSNQTNMASPWNGKWLPLRTRFRTLRHPRKWGLVLWDCSCTDCRAHLISSSRILLEEKSRSTAHAATAAEKRSTIVTAARWFTSKGFLDNCFRPLSSNRKASMLQAYQSSLLWHIQSTLCHGLTATQKVWSTT